MSRFYDFSDPRNKTTLVVAGRLKPSAAGSVMHRMMPMLAASYDGVVRVECSLDSLRVLMATIEREGSPLELAEVAADGTLLTAAFIYGPARR